MGENHPPVTVLPEHVKALKAQTVYVRGRGQIEERSFANGCTGLIWRQTAKYTYVLTVNHLVFDMDLRGVAMMVYVGKDAFPSTEVRPPAEIVKRTRVSDLMLLRVTPPIEGTPVFLGEEPMLDEEVVEVGYSLGTFSVFHGRIAALYTKIVSGDPSGHPMAQHFPTIHEHWVDINTPNGASGSGIFSKPKEQWELKGILNVHNFDGSKAVFYAIPLSAIRKFSEDITYE